MVGGTVVVLSRDSSSTPWGFRLQGGAETQCPLTVQRVFVGGVSDGRLQRGDVVIGIQGRDSSNMYHSQAEDLIKGAGKQLNLNVWRGGGSGGASGAAYNGVQSPQQHHSVPQSPPWGSNAGGGEYVNEPGRSHLGAGDQDEDYSKSVGDIKKIFSKPTHYQTYSGIRHNASPGTTSYVPKRPVFVKPPSIGPEVAELGWVPKNKPSPYTQNRYGPASMRSPPVNRRNPGTTDLDFYQSQPTHFVHREPPERPAWLGTLRSSGGPRQWEIQEQQSLVGRAGGDRPAPPPQSQRAAVHAQSFPGGGPAGRVSPVVVHNPKVQTVRYGPGGDGPVYEQHDPSHVDSSTARVAHLQYNTPLGLYSKENALEALRGQTKGKPGEGTMAITGVGGPSNAYNPAANSDLHRLIQEEESARRGGGRPTSGGRHGRHAGGDSGFSDF